MRGSAQMQTRILLRSTTDCRSIVGIFVTDGESDCEGATASTRGPALPEESLRDSHCEIYAPISDRLLAKMPRTKTNDPGQLRAISLYFGLRLQRRLRPIARIGDSAGHLTR